MEGRMPEQPHADLILWTVGDVAKGIGLVICLTLLIAFGLGIGTILLLGSEALPELGPDMFSGLLALLEARGLLQEWVIMVLAGMAVAEGAMFAVAWLFSSVKYRCGWQALGFRPFNIRRASIMVAVVLVAAILLNLLYEWVLPSLGEELPTTLPPQLTQTGVGLALVSIEGSSSFSVTACARRSNRCLCKRSSSTWTSSSEKCLISSTFM